MNKVIGIAGTLALFVGCTAVSDDTGDTSGTEDGFQLLENSDDTLEAVVSEAGAELHVLIAQTSDQVVDVTYDFGDTVVAFSVNHSDGVGEFMPSGEALDAADSRLIDLAIAGVAAVIPEDTDSRTLVQETAYRVGQLVQIVPVGEQLAEGTFKSERGWTHISPSCGNQYIGSGYYRVCGKGCGCGNYPANGCAGRCGQGCGGTSSPPCTGWTVYTRDCAKHDYGLGSWWAASDDYSFASNNASCGGNCY
jgi:hypothetical protein